VGGRGEGARPAYHRTTRTRASVPVRSRYTAPHQCVRTRTLAHTHTHTRLPFRRCVTLVVCSREHDAGGTTGKKQTQARRRRWLETAPTKVKNDRQCNGCQYAPWHKRLFIRHNGSDVCAAGRVRARAPRSGPHPGALPTLTHAHTRSHTRAHMYLRTCMHCGSTWRPTMGSLSGRRRSSSRTTCGRTRRSSATASSWR
jgi:hypothetical protein